MAAKKKKLKVEGRKPNTSVKKKKGTPVPKGTQKKSLEKKKKEAPKKSATKKSKKKNLPFSAHEAAQKIKKRRKMLQGI